MNRNVSLIRYKKFGSVLLMFEHINENVAIAIPDTDTQTNKTKLTDRTFDEKLKTADESVKTLYQDLTNYTLSLGDNVSETHLKFYAAFKKIRNIVTVIALKKN